MIDEKAVWDDIWPVVERLISATVAEDTPTIRPLLYPNSQAADALDIFGFPAFDILLKTVLGHNRLGLTRAIEGDDGRAVFIEFAWLDPESGSGYTGVDMVTVRLDAVGAASDWLVTEINPTNADLPLNGPHATSILTGTQALSEDGKLPSEPWVLPVAFIAGSLQLPLTPGAAADPVEKLLLPGMQARKFGPFSQIYARRLWRDFVATGGEIDPAERTGAWAAAVEVIIGGQSGRKETQATVSRHYRVSLGGVANRVNHIRRALGIDGLDARYSELISTEIVYKESDK